jgi:putative Holliday junction resolvase
LATPITVIDSTNEDTLVDEVLKLATQYKADCIVVGLPRTLNGALGKQANKVTAFADKLSWQAKQNNLHELDVQLWDERLSTKAAERLKIEASSKGNRMHSRAKRGTKSHRFSAKSKMDAIAAAFILQGFLDSHHLE